MIGMLMGTLKAADPYKSGINVVGVCHVTPELTRLNCIQHVSISTRVSLSTFARWQHCIDQYMVLYRYYLLQVDTAMEGGLHARLCYAFLVLQLIHL